MITFTQIAPNAVIPARATEGSAGYDLVSAEEKYIERFRWAKIRTGVSVSVGAGNVGFVCPRSGLALKHGVTVLNAPGVIDCDYEGELCVVLYNRGLEGFHVAPGMRIAQLVVVPCIMGCLAASIGERGANGFGSTGA